MAATSPCPAACRSLSPAQVAAATSDQVTVGVRPEAWDIGAENGLHLVVDGIEDLGAEALLYCTSEGRDDLVIVRVDGLTTIGRNERVVVAPKRAQLHLFDTATGLRLPD